MALISIAMALSFSGAKDRANFNEAEIEMLDLIQKARGSALSSVLVGTDPVDYYELDFEESGITLTAVSETGTSEEIDGITFEPGITISTAFEVYYFPPYGDVCFSSGCSDTVEGKNFTLESNIGESVTYRISRYGGYPEEL